MSAKQVIDELSEWLGREMLRSDKPSPSPAEILEKLSELEQKHCKEEKKGCYACSECGHPHLFEDLIYFEGNGEIADEL